MKFLQSLFNRKPGRFWTEAAHRKDLVSQLEMTPQTLDQLRTLGVSADKALSLEYFFYTNTPEKAAALAEALRSSLGYSPEHRPSASNKRESIVTGWTTRMLMSNAVVSAWTREMCEIGFAHDCEFDGWGTTPDQETNIQSA